MRVMAIQKQNKEQYSNKFGLKKWKFQFNNNV